MKKLDPNSLTLIIDTREQTPLDLSPMRTIRQKLDTGDYGCVGIDEFGIERKSLPDLIACIGRERERFEREIKRLLAYPVRCVIVECSWQDLEAGQWISKISAHQAMQSVLSWMSRGIPFIFSNNRLRSSEIVRGLIYHHANHLYRQWHTAFGTPTGGGTPRTSKPKILIEGDTSQPPHTPPIISPDSEPYDFTHHDYIDLSLDELNCLEKDSYP